MNELLEHKKWEAELLAFSIPRWDELPEIDVYMDQLVKIVDRYTNPLLLDHTKALTPSMINNYVKLKLVPKPQKKKYTRHQIARVIIITLLKQVFEIPDIRNGIEFQIHSTDSKDAYNFFCNQLEKTIENFINENHEEISIEQIKDGYAPVQMACTTFIAKLITENNLRDLLSKQKMEDK